MDARTLSQLPLETLESRFESAHDALARLYTGEREVDVGFRDGRRVRYAETDVAKLERYVETLSQAITIKRKSRPARAPVYLEF